MVKWLGGIVNDKFLFLMALWFSNQSLAVEVPKEITNEELFQIKVEVAGRSAGEITSMSIHPIPTGGCANTLKQLDSPVTLDDLSKLAIFACGLVVSVDDKRPDYRGHKYTFHLEKINSLWKIYRTSSRWDNCFKSPDK